MKRTEVENWPEFYQDALDATTRIAVVNPALFKEIAVVLDRPPHFLCMLWAYIPITKWTKVTQRSLLETAGITFPEMVEIKKQLGERII